MEFANIGLTAGPKDNESRMGTIRNNDRRVHHRHSPPRRVKCANPLALAGRRSQPGGTDDSMADSPRDRYWTREQILHQEVSGTDT